MQKTEMLMKLYSTQLSRKIFSYLFPVPSFQNKSHLTRFFYSSFVLLLIAMLPLLQMMLIR